MDLATYGVVGATAPGQLGVVQFTIPEPVEDQVLIKVECSTLGPFDLTNLDRQFFVFGYPYIFGISAAGTVAKVGPNATNLKVGDRVTTLALPPGSKGLQAYTVQSQSVVAKIPDTLSFEEAVTLPDSFVTAYYTLFHELGLPIPSEWPARNNPNAGVKMFLYQEDERLAKRLMPSTLPKFIELGLQPNRVRLLDHADLLTRVGDGFDLLRQGKINGERLVIKV